MDADEFNRVLAKERSRFKRGRVGPPTRAEFDRLAERVAALEAPRPEEATGFACDDPTNCGGKGYCETCHTRQTQEVRCAWCGTTGYGLECPPCEKAHEGEPLPAKEADR